MEVFVGIIFGLLLVVFMTLGSVLIIYFFAAHLTTSTRSLLSSALATLVMLGPAFIISSYDGSASTIGFVAGAAVMVAIAFPVAFLATRKLDRRKQRTDPNIGAVFE